VQHTIESRRDDKERARERKEELLPRKIKPNTDPWRDANNHGYEFEKDIKRPLAKVLTNMEIYRMSMIPRSYDQRVRTEVHKQGYKLTSNSIGEFGIPDQSCYTKEGLMRKTAGIAQFEKHCKEHYDAEMYYKNNKR
jgi:hypothetical protein